MKKYVATQCDPEWFDYKMYYDEGMAEEDNIWAGGNRDFCETNASLRKDVVRDLEDCAYDLEATRDDYTDENNEITDRAEYEAEVNDTIRCYFRKNNKEALTDEEIATLARLCEEFKTCSSRDENAIICEVLTIEFGEQFEEGEIHGCCQGDWMEIIYPASRKAMIPFIEAVWFATGTEFAITADKIEVGENNEIDEEKIEETGTYFDYTGLWRDEDIKNWLAENLHCSPEEIVLRKIKDTCVTRHFNYEVA